MLEAFTSALCASIDPLVCGGFGMVLVWACLNSYEPEHDELLGLAAIAAIAAPIIVAGLIVWPFL